MKTTSFIAVTCLAHSMAASPLRARADQAESGIFGQGNNIFSSIFDQAACLVRGFIGGGNPNCKGKGQAVVVPTGDHGSDKESSQYTYSYDTNSDGTLKVTVTLARGGTCTYTEKPDGTSVQAAIDGAAKKCLAEKK